MNTVDLERLKEEKRKTTQSKSLIAGRESLAPRLPAALVFRYQQFIDSEIEKNLKKAHAWLFDPSFHLLPSEPDRYETLRFQP